jgi:hypothetical protein
MDNSSQRWVDLLSQRQATNEILRERRKPTVPPTSRTVEPPVPDPEDLVDATSRRKKAREANGGG